MGIVKRQREEIERKKSQIERLKEGIRGRNIQLLKYKAQAEGAEAVLSAIVKQYGTIEVDAKLAAADRREVRAVLDPERNKWILTVKE